MTSLEVYAESVLDCKNCIRLGIELASSFPRSGLFPHPCSKPAVAQALMPTAR
jgi:hypothetical protein